MGGRTNVPVVSSITVKIGEDEAKRVARVKELLATAMAEYAIAKAKGRI